MTEFLIVIAVVDLLVFAVLYSVMKAGRAHDRASEAQARALWASSERVRRETPLEAPARRPPGIAGQKVVDAYGTLLGVAGELLSDPLDGSSRWLEVHVRGLGASRTALVPSEGLALDMNVVRAPRPRDQILRAPVVARGPLTRESEIALCRHYGMSRRAGELYGRRPGEPTGVSSAQLVA